VYHSIRFTSRKIRQRLSVIQPLVQRNVVPLPPFRYLELEGPQEAPPVTDDIQNGRWTLIAWGSHWGPSHTSFVLRTEFRVPSHWPESSPAVLHLPIGEAGDFSHPEALAYIDGRPFAACDRHHQEVLLPLGCRDGSEHLLALHGWTGSLRNDPNARLLMRQCAVVEIDAPTRALVMLAELALGAADCLSDDDPARAHLLSGLDGAFRALDLREPVGERFYDSVPRANEILSAAVNRAGPPLDVQVVATGHAHLDVAWLWTLDQTRRKVGRTFHTAIRLMEQYPAFAYSQSQAQLYEFAQDDYPTLFEEIKERVREGRWEPIGGMWVETDCNITGGEALARQFLLGRSYFERHFGPDADAQVMWLPDVFGFAWSLPQLAKQAGLDYFFTIKIGWNLYNRLPYDSFWWQGLDGTRILTHFSPTPAIGSDYASTFNAVVSPEQVLGTWRNFQQKDWGPAGETLPLLMSFGYGDGGGGPTREMLDTIEHLAHFPSLPQVRCGLVGDFFRQLEAQAGDRLPTWNGELYLENHRGTYTTQSRSKRANRKSEFLLHDAEFVAALSAQLDPDYAYPHSELQRAWKLVCLNQFHDILPGSSIGAVYTESLQQYAEVRQIGERVRDEALAAVASKVGGDLLVLNPTSFALRELAFWPGDGRQELGLQQHDGSAVAVQRVEGGWLLDAGELPPCSVTGLSFTTSTAQAACTETNHSSAGALAAQPGLVENDLLRVELSADGDIVRIYDKAQQREVLPAGGIANQLQAFEDRPINPDAWDIEVFYDDKQWLAEPAESIRVVEHGPLRATLEIRRRILDSEYVQRISLQRHSARLDFDTEIEWQERHTLLKVVFPVNVLSPRATYEIQWGNVERPTHRNTSWDWARFEVAAQKWVDLSEGGYGVSVLNDCKYGHDVHGNVVRISLLRGTTNPDPDADQGEHRFAYSLLPHSGRWDERTISQAYALNDAPIVWRAERAGIAMALTGGAISLARTDTPNVVIETIKQAEDGRGLIVRLYESQRRRGRFTLSTQFPLAEVWRTNLLEQNEARLGADGHTVSLSIKPYEIITLRLVPDHAGDGMRL
jgi:alpha-mannosidase